MPGPFSLTIQPRKQKALGMRLTLTQTGVRPDITKIKAILDYPPPTSKQDLQCLLGMRNFIAKFLPQLSDVTAPL
jgi:hypothetical protein